MYPSWREGGQVERVKGRRRRKKRRDCMFESDSEGVGEAKRKVFERL